MQKRKLIYSSLLFLMVISLVLGLIVNFNSKSGNLQVILFDVGQGDAILISIGSNQILIDGGRNGKLLLEKLGRHIPFWDRQIEMVVVTHPDQDHIGGLIDVLEAYNVKTIMQTGAESDSRIHKAWKNSVASEGAETIEALEGIIVDLSEKARAEVLYPYTGSNTKNSNESSVVLKLDFGDNKFLFTGDLPGNKENLLDVGEIDFLKVSHHGSKYSTSAEFLGKLNPKEAIISVGNNNKYGHPNEDVLGRLVERSIKILRTDKEGDIIYICAGENQRCMAVVN